MTFVEFMKTQNPYYHPEDDSSLIRIARAAFNAGRDYCRADQIDAERYRKLRDEDAWGEDSGSDWGDLGELHGAEFDAVVDALPRAMGDE